MESWGPSPGDLRSDLQAESYALHACVLDGHISLLRRVLAAAAAAEPRVGLNLDHQHDKWGTPLHVAVWVNRLPSVEALISAGADLTVADDFLYNGSLDEDPGWSPVSLAAALGHPDILKLCLRRLPRESILENSPYITQPAYALISAAQYGRLSSIIALSEWETSWPQYVIDEALATAAFNWQFHTSRYLIQRHHFSRAVLAKALENAVFGNWVVYDPRLTALQPTSSAHVDREELVGLLIKAGADPDTLEFDGEPLLPVAASNHVYTGALKALLENGADPNVSNSRGLTALHIVSEPVQVNGRHSMKRSNDTAIHLLLAKRAKVMKPGPIGDTPLHIAAFGSRLDIFRLYLSSIGTEPEEEDRILKTTTNEKGDSLLHFAAAGGNVEIMLFLIERGCAVNAKNSMGWTPLICALVTAQRTYSGRNYSKKLPQIAKAVDLLLSHGADPSVVTQEGWTPLHCLARYRDEDLDREAENLAISLVEHGAPIHVRASVMTESYPHPADKDKERYHWGWKPELPRNGQTISPAWSPLQWAAEYGALGVVRALCVQTERSHNSDNPSPARIAAESRFLGEDLRHEICDLLISSGFDF